MNVKVITNTHSDSAVYLFDYGSSSMSGGLEFSENTKLFAT